jgi:hypothetical protein
MYKIIMIGIMLTANLFASEVPKTIKCEALANKYIYYVSITKTETGYLNVVSSREEVTGTFEQVFSGQVKLYQTGDGENGYWFNKYYGKDSMGRTIKLKYDSDDIWEILEPEYVTLECR